LTVRISSLGIQVHADPGPGPALGQGAQLGVAVRAGQGRQLAQGLGLDEIAQQQGQAVQVHLGVGGVRRHLGWNLPHFPALDLHRQVQGGGLFRLLLLAEGLLEQGVGVLPGRRGGLGVRRARGDEGRADQRR
jgi:hypothetical protein